MRLAVGCDWYIIGARIGLILNYLIFHEQIPMHAVFLLNGSARLGDDSFMMLALSIDDIRKKIFIYQKMDCMAVLALLRR